MRILLLGANGQVGFELARSLAPLGELHRAMRPGARASALTVDLTRPETLEAVLAQVAPEVVVNAAAHTAVDRAEDEAELADAINHRALAMLGAWAASRGALIVHFSTDYVFDGRGQRPYREDDTPAPLGVYGASKLAGERALRASGAPHLILRTAWVYAARGHNFLRTMLRLGRERGRVQVVDDQRGAPTSARWIAAATAVVLARLVTQPAGIDAARLGTYHLAAHGDCTWYDFACAIFAGARAAGLLDTEVVVEPIATAQFPTRARRPAYSVLDTSKLRAAFGIHSPPWQQGLELVIDELAVQASG